MQGSSQPRPDSPCGWVPPVCGYGRTSNTWCLFSSTFCGRASVWHLAIFVQLCSEADACSSASCLLVWMQLGTFGGSVSLRAQPWVLADMSQGAAETPQLTLRKLLASHKCICGF